VFNINRPTEEGEITMVAKSKPNQWRLICKILDVKPVEYLGMIKGDI
jgi:hypothetical protein